MLICQKKSTTILKSSARCAGGEECRGKKMIKTFLSILLIFLFCNNSFAADWRQYSEKRYADLSSIKIDGQYIGVTLKRYNDGTLPDYVNTREEFIIFDCNNNRYTVVNYSTFDKKNYLIATYENPYNIYLKRDKIKKPSDVINKTSKKKKFKEKFANAMVGLAEYLNTPDGQLLIANLTGAPSYAPSRQQAYIQKQYEMEAEYQEQLQDDPRAWNKIQPNTHRYDEFNLFCLKEK